MLSLRSGLHFGRNEGISLVVDFSTSLRSGRNDGFSFVVYFSTSLRSGRNDGLNDVISSLSLPSFRACREIFGNRVFMDNLSVVDLFTRGECFRFAQASTSLRSGRNDGFSLVVDFSTSLRSGRNDVQRDSSFRACLFRHFEFVTAVISSLSRNLQQPSIHGLSLVVDLFTRGECFRFAQVSTSVEMKGFRLS